MKAAIKAVNGYVPEYILTNAELESMVDTSDEWISTRTGIKERHILKGEARGSTYMAVQAIEGLLAKAGIEAAEVDMLICATVTPDMTFPDNANTICSDSGMTNAWGFDINAACSGFLYALSTGARFVESGRYKNVVVVGTDKMSSIVDYQDRTTCIIFGDGAGAVLLQPSDSGYGYEDEIMQGDGRGRQYLYKKAGGSLHPITEEAIRNKEHFVTQVGRPVFKAAVAGMTDTLTRVMERNDLSTDIVDWVVPHQANQRIISAVAQGIRMPIEKVMVNIHKYGNTTAATIPLCLWEYESQLKAGDKLLLTAFGGGFTWGSAYLTWDYTPPN